MGFQDNSQMEKLIQSRLAFINIAHFANENQVKSTNYQSACE